MDHRSLAVFEERLYQFGRDHFRQITQTNFDDLRNCPSRFTETVISLFEEKDTESQEALAELLLKRKILYYIDSFSKSMLGQNNPVRVNWAREIGVAVLERKQIKEVENVMLSSIPSRGCRVKTDRQALFNILKGKAKEFGYRIDWQEKDRIKIDFCFDGWIISSFVYCDESHLNCTYNHSINWKSDPSLFPINVSMFSWLGLHGNTFWCKEDISMEELGDSVWKTIGYFPEHCKPLLSDISPS